MKACRRLSLKNDGDDLKNSLPPSLQLAKDLARGKGVTNWLAMLSTEEQALPPQEGLHGCHLP